MSSSTAASRYRTTPEVPQLEADALRAVSHRGSHLQIVASAGSGKTEVVSQRIADLLASGVQADEMVAFTFTEGAAESLRKRIEVRVQGRLGRMVHAAWWAQEGSDGSRLD